VSCDAAVEVELDLEAKSRSVGRLRIRCLPGKTYWRDLPALVDCRGSSEAPEGQSPVQLLEDVEYRFEVELDVAGRLTLEPRDVFDLDSPNDLMGRVKPGRHTGTVFVSVVDESGHEVARSDFEVRARKLGYMDEYRWMLERIAEDAAESIMHRFSAGTHRFVPMTAGSPETIYQRFALIKAFLESDQFDEAVSLILRRPHVEYFVETEQVHPGRGLRPGKALIRSITGPGARVSTGTRQIAGLTTLPATVDRVSHYESVDTVANRFVLHVLNSWRSTSASVRLALSNQLTPSAIRGVREAVAVEERLTAIIASPLMQKVGLLESFPAGNQVLQRREGYRDVFRAFLQGEVAAALEWAGGEDVFTAGSRDVATLYEYWVYFELARIVGEVLGEPMNLSELFSVGEDRLSLELKRGRKSELRGRVQRRNREIRVSLFFNRQFQGQSWTEPVRPDCSIEFLVVGQDTEPTRLHFDAKYRVKELSEILRAPGEVPVESDGEDGPTAKAQSQDLLKMHAYRDAVRRSAGAYVLYPGSDDNPERKLPKYHEILPGIGAFVLRPTSDGRGAGPGVGALARFIDDVIDHLAARGTSRERSGFWEDTSYEGWSEKKENRVDAVLHSQRPPADVPVLLGFVRNEAHRQWIRTTGLYNLRSDGRKGSVGVRSPELSVDLVVLYNPNWDKAEVFRATGFVALKTKDQLIESGYPNPGSDLYLCLELGGPVDAIALAGNAASLLAREGRARPEWGAPRVVSWLDIQLAIGDGLNRA